MKYSFILLSFFLLGAVLGKTNSHFALLIKDFSLEEFLLYSLLFFVGISIGSDTRAIEGLFKVNLVVILIPLLVAIGSIGGAAIGSFFVTTLNLKESMAVGAGFGYYSLSSVIIGKIKGEIAGTIALLSNIIREIFTLILTPILCNYLGKLSPIACGGATSTDTTLPVIYRCLGRDFAIISVINGAVLSILVPIVVPIILS